VTSEPRTNVGTECGNRGLDGRVECLAQLVFFPDNVAQGGDLVDSKPPRQSAMRRRGDAVLVRSSHAHDQQKGQRGVLCECPRHLLSNITPSKRRRRVSICVGERAL
jgi:hypothetical protein